jgi:hypothetical protein
MNIHKNARMTAHGSTPAGAAGAPGRQPGRTIVAIERLRQQRWTGPRIAPALGRPVSTVGVSPAPIL